MPNDTDRQAFDAALGEIPESIVFAWVDDNLDPVDMDTFENDVAVIVTSPTQVDSEYDAPGAAWLSKAGGQAQFQAELTTPKFSFDMVGEWRFVAWASKGSGQRWASGPVFAVIDDRGPLPT